MRKIFGSPLPLSQARTLLYLLILILLASAKAYSQQVNLDSLNRALAGLSKIDRCVAFIHLVYTYVIELETHRDALHLALQERNVLINKASSYIFSSIATIKGLSWLGKKEMDQSKNVEYWQKLDDTSDNLSTILNSTLNSNKVNLP